MRIIIFHFLILFVITEQIIVGRGGFFLQILVWFFQTFVDIRNHLLKLLRGEVVDLFIPSYHHNGDINHMIWAIRKKKETTNEPKLLYQSFNHYFDSQSVLCGFCHVNN